MDPQEIESVEFRTTRIKEGYDPDEVDAFLDRVAGEMRTLTQELAKSEDARSVLRRRLDQYQGDRTAVVTLVPPDAEAPSAGALRILEAAQRTAEQVEADAERKANETINAAQAEADAINARLEDLKAKHEDLRLYLRSHLEAGLSELEANKP